MGTRAVRFFAPMFTADGSWLPVRMSVRFAGPADAEPSVKQFAVWVLRDAYAAVVRPVHRHVMRGYDVNQVTEYVASVRVYLGVTF